MRKKKKKERKKEKKRRTGVGLGEILKVEDRQHQKELIKVMIGKIKQARWLAKILNRMN